MTLNPFGTFENVRLMFQHVLLYSTDICMPFILDVLALDQDNKKGLLRFS